MPTIKFKTFTYVPDQLEEEVGQDQYFSERLQQVLKDGNRLVTFSTPTYTTGAVRFSVVYLEPTTEELAQVEQQKEAMAQAQAAQAEASKQNNVSNELAMELLRSQKREIEMQRSEIDRLKGSS